MAAAWYRGAFETGRLGCQLCDPEQLTRACFLFCKINSLDKCLLSSSCAQGIELGPGENGELNNKLLSAWGSKAENITHDDFRWS